MVSGWGLRADVVRPSALSAAELLQWQHMQAQSPSLRRAFLTPTFAQACERANGRAYVAILHEGGSIRGFFPFQFHSYWHQRLGVAERIGGGLCDAAGLIAGPDLRISSSSLMQLCRLKSLFITHLIEDQAHFGLDAAWSRTGYVIDIPLGPQAYFATLAERGRDFIRNTERRLRRAERDYGELRMVRLEQIPPPMIADLIAQKRAQYQRTVADDVLALSANVRLIGALNEAPAPECRLILNRLEAGNRLLAQHLVPQYHDVLSYWFPVYDPQMRDVSPGRLLLWHTIQRATQDGIKFIDRGEGDAPHKRELATGTTRYGSARWSAAGVRPLVARAYQALEWRLQDRRQSWLRKQAEKQI